MYAARAIDRTTVSLEFGDHLDQPTFHRCYEATPEDFRAELIGGVVYLGTPKTISHGRLLCRTGWWLALYDVSTPGTEALGRATIILGPDSEPEPDALLTILCGQTRVTADEYIVGAPELIAEVATSTVSYDLHSKRRDYERYGVQEYVVFVVRQKKVVWFVREDDHFVELQPDADGLLKSRVFPGLWLDPEAFFRHDAVRLREVLQRGLDSPEHHDLVQQLRQRGAGPEPASAG